MAGAVANGIKSLNNFALKTIVITAILIKSKEHGSISASTKTAQHGANIFSIIAKTLKPGLENRHYVQPPKHRFGSSGSIQQQ